VAESICELDGGCGSCRLSKISRASSRMSSGSMRPAIARETELNQQIVETGRVVNC
jgi:hypothetical protein